MVESPMFFQSVQPILTSLRNFDFESFPLYKQIIMADSEDNEGFDYLPVKSSVQNTNDAVKDKMRIICEGLDEAQKEAFLYAMNHRLSIIQGPPGCGKTFLGVKIVEALLKWKLLGPILVRIDFDIKNLITRKRRAEVVTCT